MDRVPKKEGRGSSLRAAMFPSNKFFTELEKTTTVQCNNQVTSEYKEKEEYRNSIKPFKK